MSQGILIVEDDASFRKLIKFALRDGHYSFYEASSVTEAITALNNADIKVIILDLSLPFENGTSLLEQLNVRATNYRIIILTAHEELMSAEIARDFEIFNYLAKSAEGMIQSLRFSVGQAFKDIDRQLLSEQSEILLRIQKGINFNQSLEEVLSIICESILVLTQGYTCHLRLFDHHKGEFVLTTFKGPSDKMRSIFAKPKRIGEPFSGRVAATKSPFVHNDLQNDTTFKTLKEHILANEDTTSEAKEYLNSVRSAYIVPISTGIFTDEIDAVLTVTSDLPSFFSDEKKREIVDQFVTQAELGIARNLLVAKRLEVQQDYQQIIRMLADIDELSGTDILERIFDVVITRISQIINPEVISIFLFDEQTHLLEKVAESIGNNRTDDIEEVYSPGASLTGWVYDNGKTIRIPNLQQFHKPSEDTRFDPENEEWYLNNIPSRRIQHYMGVPIIIGKELVGVIRVINKKSGDYGKDNSDGEQFSLFYRGFSEDDQTILEITASHLAVSIRNAKSSIAFARSVAGQAVDFYSCFISYSSKDHSFALRLHSDLQSKGVRCWFAPEDLKVGDKVRQRIEESILLHDRLLLILSNDSISSAWVEDEVENAFEREHRENQTVLFPIRIDDSVMRSDKAWASSLRRTRHIGDFTGWREQDLYQKAFQRLIRDLKAEISS